MKKFILGLFVLFIYINVDTSSAQKTMCLKTKTQTDGAGKTIPQRSIEETQKGVTVTYSFTNIILCDDPLYRGSTLVNIDGFWPINSVGKPAVLSRWDTFVVPEDGAKVTVSDSSYIDIPMEISPARPILTNSGNETYTTDNVVPIVSYKGLYPSSLIASIRNAQYKGQQLLDVCVTPVQYDYEHKKVRVFTKIKYDIQYNISSLKKSLSKFSLKKSLDNTLLNNTALNISLYESEMSTKKNAALEENAPNKYLIISVPKYSAAVNRFAEWKRTLGFDVIVGMTESWDTTLVKNVVREVYDTEGLDYLLIFGGQEDIPGVIQDRIFNGVHHYHPTDLYYGCMSSDYTPDIFRGRILVNTDDEAMTVVDKIINYEKNPVIDESFYKKSLHCAYFQDYDIISNGVVLEPKDGYEDRRFVLTSERIRDGMINILDSVERVYFTENDVNPTHWNRNTYANGEMIPEELRKPEFSWNGGPTDIQDKINRGVLYALMRDHGLDSCWYAPFYSRSNIHNLTNGHYLPVIFSICCHTGKFDESNCFSESFLKKADGGCVAIYGATQTSLSGPNDVMAEGMFDAIWPSLNLRPQFGIVNGTSYSPTPTPTYRLGQILDQGLKRIQEAYLGTNSAWYPQYTSELFHCFGDPSMMIYTEKPSTFSNASINRQSDGMIYVNTGGILGTISFYNRRTGAVHTYWGYSASYPDDPEISVCISAHNMIPYLDEGTLYIQNQTLTEDRYFEAQTIKVGNNVTTTRPQGNVNFTQGDFHLIGKEVILNPGTTISIGSTLEIKNK